MVVDRLSVITDEERAILNGRKSIDRYIYMDGSRDVISGEKLLEKGKLIAIRPHIRFIAFPEHTHDYVEMVYMCQGETRHTVNGNVITLRQGELLMLGQNAHQSIEAAGEQDIAVNFIVRPAFFSGTRPFLGEEETPLRRFVVSCLTGEYEAGYLLFHVAELLPVQNLVENLLFTLLYDTPHGVACAILLLLGLEYNMPVAGERYRAIGRAMEVPYIDSMNDEDAAKATIAAVKKLGADVGIPADLKEIVKDEDVQFLSESAFADACCPGNPRDTSVEEIAALYRSLM